MISTILPCLRTMMTALLAIAASLLLSLPLPAYAETAEISADQYIEVVKKLLLKDELLDAEETLEEAIKIYHDNPEIRYLMGVVDEREGEILSARKHYKYAILLNRDYVAAYMGWGRISIELDNAGDLKTAFKKALYLDSNNLEAAYQLGLYYQKHKLARAENYLKKALELQPDHQPSLVAIVAFYTQFRQKRQAKIYQQKLLQLSGDDKSGTNQLIAKPKRNYLGFEQKPAKASQRKETGPSIKAGDTKTSLQTANELIRKGAWQKAERVLTRLIKQDRTDPEAKYLLGVVYENIGQFSEARRAYKYAARLDKQHLDAYLGWAHMELELGDGERAITPYKGVVRIDPDNLEGHYQLGILYNEHAPKGSKKPLSHLEKALDIDPDHRPTLEALVNYYTDNINIKYKAMEYQQRLDQSTGSAKYSRHEKASSRHQYSKKASKSASQAFSPRPSSRTQYSRKKYGQKRSSSDTDAHVDLEAFHMPFDPSLPTKRLLVSDFKVAVPDIPAGIRAEKGLEAMLINALSKCKNFTVLDRDTLANLGGELRLSQAGIVSKETLVRSGRLLGAQVVIKGVVTEFSERAKGKASRTNVNLGQMAGMFGNSQGGNMLRNLNPRLGGGKQEVTGVVGLDIRFTDVETGAVLESMTARGTLTKKSSSQVLGIAGISSASEEFEQTVIGQAMRLAIQDAVLKIFEHMRRIPWRGYVAAVRPGGLIIINAGREQQMHEGGLLNVISEGETVTDPSSGLVLFTEQKQIAEARIIKLEDNVSFAEIIRGDNVKRGDIVSLRQE